MRGKILILNKKKKTKGNFFFILMPKEIKLHTWPKFYASMEKANEFKNLAVINLISMINFSTKLKRR